MKQQTKEEAEQVAIVLEEFTQDSLARISPLVAPLHNLLVMMLEGGDYSRYTKQFTEMSKQIEVRPLDMTMLSLILAWICCHKSMVRPGGIDRTEVAGVWGILCASVSETLGTPPSYLWEPHDE